MQEPFNEKMSLFVDDELNSQQALELLESIRDNEEFKAKLRRYQLVGQVLKNSDSFMLDSGFADKIHQQIRQEPIYFLPKRKAPLSWRKAALVIAASVALAAVWVAGKMDKQAQPYPAIAAAPAQDRPNEVNERLNEYLQAHDNAVYVNNAARPHPYARVAGYQQE